MRRAFRTRLRILAGVLLVFAVLLVGRLYFIQVVKGSTYAELGERQYVSSSQALYDRGNIYFTQEDGTLISAATLETGFLIAIDPEELKNPQSVYSEINAITPIDQTAFLAAASKTTDPYEIIEQHVSESDGQAVSALNIPGVLVELQRWRVYPAGSEAAHILGFLAFGNNNVYAGQAGLEEEYNKVLERPSEGEIGNFFAELFANLATTNINAQDSQEGDVITSIEPEVEQKLDQEIQAVNTEYHSTETGGIIMNPKTGAIIAIDSYPTFDPNDLADSNPQYFGDPLVQSEYEFGSIQKSLTMASGLDSGAITANETYDDTGCIYPNHEKVCNFDLVARGITPMIQILDQSLNVGAAFIAGQMGHATQRKYDTELGLGEKTGIDLPGEVSGKLQNLNTNEDVDFDTASFGQGIAVTPIEMIRALAANADNGNIVTPHVATAIQDIDGTTRPLTYPAPIQVFKPSTAATVTQMLVTVFPCDAIIATQADPSIQMPKVTVAAKTGTAQIVNPQGGYYRTVFFHSFWGYFPADDPQFAILLYTNRPQGVEYAAGTLTGPFMDLTNFLANYYELPPAATPTPTPSFCD
jgi:cell division protein FtsI/penicillin-binding protein 2